MGVYFRKSIKFGPVRLNLGSKGVGYSVGVKGLRAGISSNGKGYVAGGGHGVYFRQNLDPKTGRGRRRSNQLPTAAYVPDAIWPTFFALVIFFSGPLFGLLCWSSKVWLGMMYIAAFFMVVQVGVIIYYLIQGKPIFGLPKTSENIGRIITGDDDKPHEEANKIEYNQHTVKHNMNIKEFTESAIQVYLEHGGRVHPDITLDIFQLIEKNESLLSDYKALQEHYKEINPTIGKTIREHFDLRNDKVVSVEGRCSLVKVYMRFHAK